MRELLQIGLNALLPADAPNLILPPPKAFAPKRAVVQKNLHYHRYAEIGIVVQGEMTIWWEGVISRCPPRSLFVIPPGTRYLPHVLEDETPCPPHSVVWLALHRGSAVAHVCRLEGKTHFLSEYYRFAENQVTGTARSLAQELANRSAHYEIALRGSLLCLFTWLLRAPLHSISRHSGVGLEQAVSPQDTFQQSVEDYLASHYHRPVTLAQVARSVGCSPSYLCRRFRVLTGQTPFQYLKEIRIEAAKRLLLSDVPIARVAEMVGFDDPLYFSKVFSRLVGIPPQGYRAQQKTP
jgi:AraC-like DNA-binding protein